MYVLQTSINKKIMNIHEQTLYRNLNLVITPLTDMTTPTASPVFTFLPWYIEEHYIIDNFMSWKFVCYFQINKSV